MLFLHSGFHNSMTAREILAHVLEPDHIAAAALLLGVVFAVRRVRRRAAARAIVVRKGDRS